MPRCRILINFNKTIYRRLFLIESQNATASKSVALDAFQVFLQVQVTGRVSLDQLLLNREESCSLSLFTVYTEHLYAYKQPRNQQNYQMVYSYQMVRPSYMDQRI